LWQHEIPVRIHDEHGSRQCRGQISREDQRNVLLGALHAPTAHTDLDTGAYPPTGVQLAPASDAVKEGGLVGFTPASDVVVRAVADDEWELVHPLIYEGNKETFVVPAGTRTDFASVPRVFVWFLPKYGPYTKAAILHDHLWSERAAKGTLSWADANGIFRRAMCEIGVAFLRRWIMWAAVRWAALRRPGGRKGWLKESWQVLLATALALPIVVLPAIAILAALLVFWLVELVFWAPIRVSGATREGPPAKPVNLPGLDLSAS